MRTLAACAVSLFLVLFSTPARAADLLVEAESFDQPGGWMLDTQFIQIMGSPYLLAHGLGRPVEDAATSVEIPEAGRYRVWVRTKNWVAPWDAPGAPGRFQLLINGSPLAETFGTKGADWFWHDGGTVDLEKGNVELRLHDLTGFEGRCDAVLLTTALDAAPPNDPAPLAQWRRRLLGLPETPPVESFDLVVIGGGYAGTASAISAARMGLKVALVQDRPVLGGNGSSEIRVWAQGLTRRGRYPRLGEIVEEFGDRATQSPGVEKEFGDDKKEALVRSEKNITLLLNHHAYAVETEGSRITAVRAFDTRTSREIELRAPLFADCTGHGTIGFLAGADYDVLGEGHMGMSNMWRWENGPEEKPFPEVPWALQLKIGDFPYPQGGFAPWFWESGFDQDPIADLEKIRDWNFRAAYGAFAAMKHGEKNDEHRGAQLTWMAYIGGNRESRRLLGDVVLTEEDVVSKRDFPDGCVPSTWSIDLHLANPRYVDASPENPFISEAHFGQGVDRRRGYPVPYRCFYSRNIDNLFMAGRCISVTHEALGTVRVMRTGGMMGEVVGKAASICVERDCMPRDVYEKYWADLDTLMKLPGIARRDTVADPIRIEGTPPPPIYEGLAPESLDGLVMDSLDAKMVGSWNTSSGVAGFIGDDYEYTSDQKARAEYTIAVPESGRYEVRVSYTPHPNRTDRARMVVVHADGKAEQLVNQRAAPPIAPCWQSLGTYRFEKDVPARVTIYGDAPGGCVVADAVQLLPVEE